MYYVIHRSPYGPAVVTGPMTYQQAQSWIASQPREYAVDCYISH